VNPLRWRPLTWIVWGWTLGLGALGVLLVAGTAGGECGAGTDPDACAVGTVIAGGLWLGLVFCVWFVGFVILALVWLMTRPRA
jgi:hypothetical protein